MSLLHRALKKAEKDREGERLGGGLVDDEILEAAPSRVRLYILISLVFLGLLGTAYFRLWRGQKAPQGRSLTTTISPVGEAPASGESLRLQQEAELLMGQRKWGEAKGVWERLVVMEPRNPEFYNNLGLTLRQAGDLDAAEEQYRKALSLKSDFAEAENNLGVIYLLRHESTQARDALQKAIELRSDYAEPYFHLALLSESEGKAQEAKQYYTKYIDLAKGVDADLLLRIQQRISRLGSP